MPEQLINFKLFLASPGDVLKERKIVFDVIEEINKLLVLYKNHLPYRLDPKAWEKAIPMAGLPQTTLANQLKIRESDIFVGIFWNRFGMPPGIKHVDDGMPFFSGTEWEFDQAFQSYKEIGKPLIMLYRKVDKVDVSRFSSEETDQFTKVNQFFKKTEPQGQYEAFFRTFQSKEFRSLAWDHLQKAALMLYENLKEAEGEKMVSYPLLTRPLDELKGPAGDAVEPTAEKQRLETNETSESIDHQTGWLQSVGLSQNPFRHYYADDDDKLIGYYLLVGDLKPLSVMDLLMDPRIWLIFGSEGSGKTALRRYIASRGFPTRPTAEEICYEYCMEDFIKARTDAKGNFNIIPTYFLKGVFEYVKELNTGKPFVPDWKAKGRPQEALASLSQAFREAGIKRVVCLIDPLYNVFAPQNEVGQIVDALVPLINLYDPGSIRLRFFLPEAVEAKLMETMPEINSPKYRVLHLNWTESDLASMLSERMIKSSATRGAYRSLGQICDAGNGFDGRVDSEIIGLANGNPRAAMWLANRLIEQHTSTSAPPKFIQPKSWDEVKDAWWFEEKQKFSQGLVSQDECFWTLGEKIFFRVPGTLRSEQLVLTRQENRLMRSIIQMHGEIVERETLKKIVWETDATNTVPDSTLNIAVQRLNIKLVDALAKHEIPAQKWIDTLRGRGYRLIKPGESPRGRSKNAK